MFESNLDNQDKKVFANWLVRKGFAIFPIDPESKKPAIKEWQKYSTTPLSDEEKKQYLEMVNEGYNYAIPGGQKGLVILDFEDKELLKAWIGEIALNDLCSKTLCVTTPHGGIHIYVIADDIPPKKFNPVFERENKGIADLQSFNSYVVGPGSCINHKYCESDKCPWKSQDYVTCYTPYNDIKDIGKVDLKSLLKFFEKKGKKLGIELSASARVWVYGEKSKEETKESEDFEKLKKEMLKYDKFKDRSIDRIREEICKKIKEKLETVQSEKAKQTLQIARGVICEGKSYADLGIDRSRGDWNLIIYLMRHGVTDPNKILKLLPGDSKAKENEKWDVKKYFILTLKNAWIIVNLEIIKKELKKYDNGKSIEKVKEEICSKRTNKLVKEVICQGKSYADVGIDKTKGDWNVILFLMRHGGTDPNKILKLLPGDSKARENETLDGKKYLLDTLKNAWAIAKKYIRLKKNLISAENISEIKAEVQETISEIILKKYKIKTFYQINGESDAIVGIFKWDKKHGVYEPFENRLRKLVRNEIEFVQSMIVSDSVREKKKIKMVKVLSSVVDSIVDEIRDKTLTPFPDDVLRVAFPNVTLEWKDGKPILIFDRDESKFAFHYIPHKINIEELQKASEKAVQKGEITIEDIEELARWVCPKTLEVFKSWVDDKWVTLFEIIGYTLYPGVKFKKAFMLLGGRDAGKTTYIKLIKDLLGKGNYSAESMRELFDPDNRFVVINLFHKLVNVTSETKEYSIDDIDRFKRLTGGDPITADVKFKKPVTFVPYAKLIVASNKLPDVYDRNDKAFWRRWLIVEFPHTFPNNDEWYYKTFTEQEMEGILTVSIMAITRVFLQKRFDFEQTPEQIMGMWLSNIDTVYSFVKTYTEKGILILDPKNGDLWVKRSDLYNMYKDYCLDIGESRVGRKAFARRLREYFGVTTALKNIDGKRVRAFVGIAVNEIEKTRLSQSYENLLDEFINYVKNNNGMIKEFWEIVKDFGDDKAKANRFVTWCLKKNFCDQRGVETFEIHT